MNKSWEHYARSTLDKIKTLTKYPWSLYCRPSLRFIKHLIQRADRW